MQKELPSNGSSHPIGKEIDLPLYKQQQIIAIIVVIFYGALSVCLLIATFLSQNVFLLPVIPLIARYWAYPFRKAIDKLLASKLS